MANPLSLGLPQGPPLAPIWGPGSQADGNLEGASGAGLVDVEAARIMSDRALMEALATNRGSFAVNLMGLSEEFGSWATSGTGVSNNSAKGPLGFWNAATITEDNSNGDHLIDGSPVEVAVLQRAPKAVSLFYRPFTDYPRNRIYLAYQDGSGHFVQQDFDLLNLVARDAVGSGEFEVVNPVLEALAGGWYRFGYGVIPNGTPDAMGSLYFAFEDDDGNTSYQGDALSGGYIVGTQIEDGTDYPNPYRAAPSATAGDPGFGRSLETTPLQDLQRYAYDYAAFLVRERSRRFA